MAIGGIDLNKLDGVVCVAQFEVSVVDVLFKLLKLDVGQRVHVYAFFC